MSWNAWIRRSHRWVSVAFVATVLAVTILQARGDELAEWVYLLPLLPLAVLALTGIWLFFLPYVARRRGARPTRQAE